MAKIAGRLQTLRVGASVDVNGIVDGSISLEVEELDSTTHDSGGFREFLTGRMAGTMDFTMKWDGSDTGQLALETASFDRTQIAVEFRMNTGSTLREYTGTAQITNWAPNGPNDDVAELSVSMRLTGTIIKGTQ